MVQHVSMSDVAAIWGLFLYIRPRLMQLRLLLLDSMGLRVLVLVVRVRVIRVFGLYYNMICIVGISPMLDPRGYHLIVLIAFTVRSCTVHCREFGKVSA